MKPLFYDYPADKTCWEIANNFSLVATFLLLQFFMLVSAHVLCLSSAWGRGANMRQVGLQWRLHDYCRCSDYTRSLFIKKNKVL